MKSIVASPIFVCFLFSAVCRPGNTFAMAKSMVQAAVAATDIQARHEQKLKEAKDASEAGAAPNRLDTQDVSRKP